MPSRVRVRALCKGSKGVPVRAPADGLLTSGYLRRGAG